MNLNFNKNKKLNIPDRYNDLNLVIIPVNNFMFFSYWDISDEINLYIKKKYNKNLNDLYLKVRNNLKKKNINYIRIGNLINLYVNITTMKLDSYNIVVDLGFFNIQNKFIILTTSNIISLPSNIIKNKNYYLKKNNNNKNYNNEFRINNNVLLNINSNQFL